MRRVSVPLVLAAVLLVAGCSTLPEAPPPKREVTLPLHLAWFEGRQIEYITTDVSDPGMARELGLNYVPRLAEAAVPADAGPGARTGVDRVYMFPGKEQFVVFPSAPRPTGPDNKDRSYSPLWQAMLVHWSAGRTPRLLNSEEAILDAQEKGDVRLTRTLIIVNCPVVRSVDGRGLAGMR